MFDLAALRLCSRIACKIARKRGRIERAESKSQSRSREHEQHLTTRHDCYYSIKKSVECEWLFYARLEIMRAPEKWRNCIHIPEVYMAFHLHVFGWALLPENRISRSSNGYRSSTMPVSTIRHEPRYKSCMRSANDDIKVSRLPCELQLLQLTRSRLAMKTA